MTIHHTAVSTGRQHSSTISQPSIPATYRERKRANAAGATPGFISTTHQEFASFLSRSAIAWRYKPRTFAIEWDAEGNLLDSITPDFYLPDCRQYLALSTEQENCAASIARRLRLLNRIHPELDVRLIAGSNYKAAVKCLLEELTGKQ